jgi:Transglycosylase SLT domain
VIRMESGYNPRAVSSKGARGVMQLMPATASMYGVANLFDPLQNIRAGVHYLKDLFNRFNSDVSLALAAYNAGPDAVVKHGGVPPYDETRSYVKAILMAYRGDASMGTLSGGFGRPARPVRPVELVGEDGRTLVANVHHVGEAVVSRPLGLR